MELFCFTNFLGNYIVLFIFPHLDDIDDYMFKTSIINLIIKLAFKLVKDCFLQASELNIIPKKKKKKSIMLLYIDLKIIKIMTQITLPLL